MWWTFCCKRIGLVVEIDGDSHYDAPGMAHDARRAAFLSQAGYRVLRFSNDDVLHNADGVFDRMRRVLGEPGTPTWTPAKTLAPLVLS